MEIKDIHKDDRGFIKIITGDIGFLSEITILQTNKGFARGGCIHPNYEEHLCVIRGSIRYFYRLPGESSIKDRFMYMGDSISIPPNTAHYMTSETDSLIAEWGPDPSEKSGKHEEFRKIVEEINRIKIND